MKKRGTISQREIGKRTRKPAVSAVLGICGDCRRQSELDRSTHHGLFFLRFFLVRGLWPLATLSGFQDHNRGFSPDIGPHCLRRLIFRDVILTGRKTSRYTETESYRYKKTCQFLKHNKNHLSVHCKNSRAGMQLSGVKAKK